MRGVVLLGVLMLGTTVRAEVRPPAVAGAFYPADRNELEREVRGFMSGAPAAQGTTVALVAPHAGYVFSGATAGKAFAALRGTHPQRVVLLGPSHHMGFSGGALPAPDVTAFATPLGDMPVDRAAVERLRALPDFSGPSAAHRPEHCLEVELPFLQVAVGNVPIVPILVGHATDLAQASRMAHALAALLEPGTAVVVSSDFTHHGPSYGYSPFPLDDRLPERLADLGRTTAERVAALDVEGFSNQVEVTGDTICGARPITVLLELLDHAFRGAGAVRGVTTSAAVSHSLGQVVTYASITFSGVWESWNGDRAEPTLGQLSGSEQTALLALARATLDSHLNHGPALASWFAAHQVSGNLAAPAGVFVTLHNRGEKAKRAGRLRGCIGVMVAREPLVDALIHAAVSAAHDPRFPPLAADELPGIGLEVSVLSPMHEVASPQAIVLGTHGVVLSKGGRRAVFLPQVATETGWDLPTFLSQLAVKAGLGPDAWRSGATFEVFTAQVFGEPE
jgi:MEMO1 family protein